MAEVNALQDVDSSEDQEYSNTGMYYLVNLIGGNQSYWS